MSSPGKPPLPAARVDFPVAVRGASLGFSILVIGILLSALVRTLMPGNPGIAMVFAPYILGFYFAARKTGQATVPILHGVVAAVGAYLLTLPLVLHDPAGRNIIQITTTLALAIGIGAITGWMTSGRTR